MKPSDPDFPFELDSLQCTLTVPTSYPDNGKPTVRVGNAEMPRGYQINVEKGFDSLVEQAPGRTLLALLNDLDKGLEKFLTAEKAKTIKIVANTDKSVKPPPPVKQATPVPSAPIAPAPTPAPGPPPPPSWTRQQTIDALAKRQADLRQLEARMGRVPNFSKSADGTRFNIPVQIANPGWLPLSLQSVKEVTLIVSKLYNLEPPTVQLKGVAGAEADSVRLAFERHAREHSDMTLMAHINHLIQNIHTMATEEIKTTPPSVASVSETRAHEEPNNVSAGEEETGPDETTLDPERPHLKVIPRPPEWNRHDSASEYDCDSDSDISYETDDNDNTHSEADQEEDEAAEHDGGATLPAAATSTSTSTSSEKGIILSFPNLELHNIELLVLVSLSLSVKCMRCKSALDITNVKPSNALPSTNKPATTSTSSSTPATSSVRAETCLKCTTPFTLSYTSSPLHAHWVRAGTVELTGCTIADLLPSTFQPTCSSCSTTFPVPPGMISVRGDTPIQVCRACHAKMTFTIPEVKFLRVSHPSTAGAEALPLRRRPKKEMLGISAGTPLPANGACPHYRHSYRWFRFGCCGRVYPCDRCHDAAEAHVNDHADRMICGWCSREQRFRPEDCVVCGRSVVRKRKAARAGFWEGGRGTREKGLMSRKEPRKYKRPPGGTLAAKKKKKDE
ncbi:hypothetical protein A1O1_00620 [Capronia coronata CBS 617.96]|uniref:CHY-type domain-containing protein n=1 Tax=Capronia coronata CBS 617.96 TaxID=1182541 RepID=W9YSI8_9EURO|nr:uncharacterized protein A1O1_00620 [Capronia coronata CBS 617.96]EXJ95498.1 hypothetical protein A1O1_00620 [Capronia coronata CBS 617.96]